MGQFSVTILAAAGSNLSGNQQPDDLGRFLVTTTDGVTGYLDDGRFVAEAIIGGKTCVYSCVIDGTTRYVGITDDVLRRGAEHMRSKSIEIEAIFGLEDLSRNGLSTAA